LRRSALSVGLFLTGLAMLASTFVWPKYCYPFVWVSAALILEPLIAGWGLIIFCKSSNTAIGGQLSPLCWALICGFFLGMWNYYSNPNDLPYSWRSDSGHFRMPLLGMRTFPLRWNIRPEKTFSGDAHLN